jgi:acyl-CoA hydrolase
LLIDRCAHPAFRDHLNRYIREAGSGHIRNDLSRCFKMGIEDDRLIQRFLVAGRPST